MKSRAQALHPARLLICSGRAGRKSKGKNNLRQMQQNRVTNPANAAMMERQSVKAFTREAAKPLAELTRTNGVLINKTKDRRKSLISLKVRNLRGPVN
jgi:hypothetical protein